MHAGVPDLPPPADAYPSSPSRAPLPSPIQADEPKALTKKQQLALAKAKATSVDSDDYK
jgi:hypothetical protein